MPSPEGPCTHGRGLDSDNAITAAGALTPSDAPSDPFGTAEEAAAALYNATSVYWRAGIEKAANAASSSLPRSS